MTASNRKPHVKQKKPIPQTAEVSRGTAGDQFQQGQKESMVGITITTFLSFVMNKKIMETNIPCANSLHDELHGSFWPTMTKAGGTGQV